MERYLSAFFLHDKSRSSLCLGIHELEKLLNNIDLLGGCVNKSTHAIRYCMPSEHGAYIMPWEITRYGANLQIVLSLWVYDTYYRQLADQCLLEKGKSIAWD